MDVQNTSTRLPASNSQSSLAPQLETDRSIRAADWQLCVAPMIDVTDRHCRYFHRLLAPRARLYTEMITTGALMHGDVARHLDFDAAEHPVALQLGGSDPADLAKSAKLGERWGYDEINLNCGCPSERVQKGAFGACLMSEPRLVADCIKAMQDAVDIPVTVKHRLGLDYNDHYGFVRDFVGAVHDTGCRVFIVHARNAVLKGLSPKANREIPPLRYDMAAKLVQDFPDSVFVLNGGLSELGSCTQALTQFHGVMLGRAAWHTPGVLSELSVALGHAAAEPDPLYVIDAMMAYAAKQIHTGVPLRMVLKSLLGWPTGRPGARHWRRMLSDARQLSDNDPALLMRAWQSVAPEGAQVQTLA